MYHGFFLKSEYKTEIGSYRSIGLEKSYIYFVVFFS